MSVVGCRLSDRVSVVGSGIGCRIGCQLSDVGCRIGYRLSDRECWLSDQMSVVGSDVGYVESDIEFECRFLLQCIFLYFLIVGVVRSGESVNVPLDRVYHMICIYYL